METIYDHNPTPEELLTIIGRALSREEYTAIPRDQQTETGRIYRLFTLRGDAVSAALYLAQITDPLYRHDLSASDLPS